jgi:DNA-binding Lrp family transcriptional regulator
MLLASRPDLVRLVKSGMSALPLRPDFWPTLAHGVGLTVDALGDALRELHDAGILAGIGGEPNPVHPDLAESLVPSPAGTAVRWRPAIEADGWHSCLAETPLPGAVAARQWYKVGWFPNLSFPETENLLEPAVDRSLLDVEPGRLESPLPAAAPGVARLLDTPRMFLPPVPLWNQIAALLDGISPDDVRASVAQLVVARRWRRFAFRLDLARAGWAGCGLAGWELPPDDAPRAAQALARVAGSGDIALRSPAHGFSCTLTALLVAREPGAGHAAAERIAAQWNRPLAFWQEVRLP